MGEALVSTFGNRIMRRGCNSFPQSVLVKISALLLYLPLMVMAIYAQTSAGTTARNDDIQVVEGTSDTIAVSLKRSLRINGKVKEAIALGGDVIVQGTVEGDVASFGGSVIQLNGATIGGDVFVFGGTYRQEGAGNLRPANTVIMYAGYEQELRNIMREPSGLLKPNWSPAYIGIRLLAVLFWFIVSLALTAAMPGTISRGIARLQLTSLRVALIGLVGAAAIGFGVPLSLRYLPTPISVLVFFTALLLMLVAWLVGRVMLHAATGRWLQRRYLPIGKNSESAALLIGSAFWVALSSLPYVWPFVVLAIFITSLGLALTARYHVGWRRRHTASSEVH